MTRYGRSPWVERFPRSRVPAYPRHHGSLSADVVVVGGGLTGCATAYAFAAAGVHVVLVEAGAIGRGRTADIAGLISEDPAVSFHEAEKALGLRRTRSAFQAWRRAALDFVALLRRLDIKCALEPRSQLTAAFNPDQLALLKREQKARKDAGLEAPLLAGRVVSAETGLSALGAMKHRDGATLDPYRACIGLAAAAAKRTARLFEHSPVKKIGFNRKWAEVHTAAGSIKTRRVVVATGAPTPLFKSLARHFWFQSRYFALTDAIPARVRRRLGTRAVVVRDVAAPPHVVRWIDDERLLVAGADGAASPDRQRDKTVVQRTGQLMYELSLLYPEISGILPASGWDAPYAKTSEGLPYIGPHRNFPHHLFAFGDSSHGVTGAYLASRIMLRQFLDEPDASDQAFEFTR